MKPKRRIYFTDTTLRDAHQSLLATRMRTEDMLPIAEKIDQAGYWSIEMWGGATFDACMRFLKEDPWERIRALKGMMPRTPFQMLLRGQNLVGYRHYPDDVVEKFVERAVTHGIQILRIFDALNDFRNIKTAVKATLKSGAKVEGTICYTTSPVHNHDLFVDMGKRLEDMGCDTICVKDMAGLLSPYDAYDFVTKLRKAVTVPLHLHTHDTSGMSVATYIKAVEAGMDILDTAISSLANGTSQPPTETLVNILNGPRYQTDLNLRHLAEIADYFREVRKKYHEFESEHTSVDPNVLIYQIPGGMTSNLASQLKEQKALDKMKQVLEEVPRVRKDFGYPPLVTPTSQIVGTQAALNVITGERYKVITTETRNYLKGLYGRTPAPIDAEVQKRAIGDEEIVEKRPADLLEFEIPRLTAELGERARNGIDDVLLYAVFPKVALEFFDFREKGGESVVAPMVAEPEVEDDAPEPQVPHLAPSEFNVKIHGETFHIKIGGMGHAGDGGRPFFIYVDDQLEEVLVESLVEVVQSTSGVIEAGATGHSTLPKPTEDGDVTTPMPGTVVKIKVKVGDRVEAGDTVVIVEAMKMENEVHSSISGEVKAVHVTEGDSVNPDEVLVAVR